jgi:hypothetical protein
MYGWELELYAESDQGFYDQTSIVSFALPQMDATVNTHFARFIASHQN